MLRYLGLTLVLLGITALVPAHAASNAALTGKVTSAAEGPMEGVVVSANRQGSTVTVSVVSDHDGTYSFPASRLPPGHYFLTTRAEGYQLDGAGVTDIAAGKTTTDDLSLRKAANLAAQLNDAEWMLSVNGTDQLMFFLLICNGCHSLQRIVHYTLTPDVFILIFDRMAMCPCSTPSRPPSDGARAAWRSAPARTSGRVGLSRRHQSQHQIELGLSAEDDAARDRQGDACHHHRIQAAATGHRAA